MIEKMEKKFGKYAIPNLTNYLIAGYIIGYVLEFGSRYTSVNLISMLTLEPYAIIHEFQFWRIISWVLIPIYYPPYLFFLAIIMIIFYWQIGHVLEQTMGTFRFNLYVFGGMFFTVIGSFVYYGIYSLIHGAGIFGIGNYFSTDYINMGLFLAFAVLYPDMEVLFYFLIPIKMKYMAIFYAASIIYDFIRMDWGGRTAIIASLFNFFIFFLSTRNLKSISPGEVKRKRRFKEQYNAGRNANSRYRGFGSGTQGGFNNPFGEARTSSRNQSSPFKKPHVHKCEICGRTEITNPELEFRYCSKCKGNHEYCSDHLFTHKHIV